MLTSGKKRQTENGHVAQAVNGDVNHHFFLFFIGCCKHDSTKDLGERKVVSVVMGQYKKGDADQDGRIKTPSPEKSEDDTPEKYFLGNGPNDAAHKIEYENLCECGRHGCIHKL